MDFWYLLMSRRATVPGRYLWGFLTPPVAGADFLAALLARVFLGAFPPVDFLAVCLVRAMTVVAVELLTTAVHQAAYIDLTEYRRPGGATDSPLQLFLIGQKSLYNPQQSGPAIIR